MALTGKQALFVEEYLICWNATEAALRAGYKGDRNVLGSVGYENLIKPDISEAISRRLTESAMSADEVLMRLADHARGNMGDFWDIPEAPKDEDESKSQPVDPVLNLSSKKAKAKFHLVKKLKVKKTERVAIEDEEPVTYRTTEIDFELYDAQAALVNIGKHHKLFADKLDVSLNVPDITADERAQADKELAEWLSNKKKSAETSNGENVQAV